MQVIDGNGRLKVEVTNFIEEVTIGVTTISGGTNGRVLYDNAGVLGELDLASTYVPLTRTISTTSPLTGGGNLSADRTLSIPKATTLVDGYLSATDWTTFNGKQSPISLTTTGTSGASTFVANTLNVPTYSLSGLGGVPTTRTLTINGTTQDLSADRTFTVSTGITIGTTAITSGTVGRVLFEGTGNVVQESANLFWDNTNGRLGVGTSSPVRKLTVLGNNNATAIFRIGNTNFAGGDSSTLEFGHQTDGSNLISSIRTFLPGDATSQLRFSTSAKTDALTITGGGNVLINTTTDAGFKLDVNGTARVSGKLTLGGDFDAKAANISQMYGYSYIQMVNGFSGTQILIQSNTVRLNNKMIVGTLASDAVASAQFQIDSTTTGFLPPRMTTTQKNAIATPATGLMVYDTTLNVITYYNGTTWI